MTSVLLVDDHPVFRRGLAALLRSAEYEIVGEAASGTEAVEAALSHRPDLIVMDLGLPGLHGARATARIIAELPDTRVVVVTAFDDDGAVREALSAGASGFVLKDAPGDEILAALAAAQSGARLLGSGVPLPGETSSERADLGLTPREQEVARFIERGLGNAAIAGRLGISEKTAANYVSTILAKLHARTRHDAAEVLREHPAE